MSHEIRTPLNSIVGFSEILIHRTSTVIVPEEFLQFLENIKTAGQTLAELINNILDLSKIEAGRMTLSSENINLKLLFQSIYHLNRYQAESKGVLLNYDFDPHVPLHIMSDRSKINQILLNMVSNAVKFTPVGKNITIRASCEDSWMVLDVIDEGIGIPVERQQTIFNAFEQGDASITRGYGGTGLGLTITRKLVELLKGTIEVHSVPDEGTTFRVKLPLIVAPDQDMDDEGISSSMKFSPESRVLLVEDNPANQVMMRSIFKDLGITLTVAENGEEGILKAVSLKPELILMDIHMPKMDGITAVQRLRLYPEFAHTPIVATTADAFLEQQQRAKKAGFTGYLTKPIEYRKLYAVLMQYLQHTTPEPTAHETTSAPLPEDVQRQIVTKLRELSEIPIFHTSKLVHHIDQIHQLGKGFTSPYTALLKQMETAAFAGNADELEHLLKEALHDKSSDS
ncbi:MAG: response regulator [SAR324 cluster bacterium]|nr:response regulator [SAR324 cluster bacterium]